MGFNSQSPTPFSLHYSPAERDREKGGAAAPPATLIRQQPPAIRGSVTLYPSSRLDPLAYYIFFFYFLAVNTSYISLIQFISLFWAAQFVCCAGPLDGHGRMLGVRWMS